MRPPRHGTLYAVLAIFLGETFGIYAEVLGAQSVFLLGRSFPAAFLNAFILIAISGVMLILGYVAGIISMKNIFVVTVASITSILIMEPVLDYVLFRQLPTLGAAIGLVLAGAGLIADLLLE